MNKSIWELMAKHLANELSEEEQQAFDAWLNKDPANKALLLKARELWNNRSYDGLSSDAKFLKSIGSDPRKVWLGIEKTIGKAPNKISPFHWTMRIAASILLIVGLGWLWNVNESKNSEPVVIMKKVYADNELREVILSDGSVVWLNRGATLAYSKTFEKDERTVFLNGEAYFDIAKDQNRPFLIQMDQSVVKILGTSFNLISGNAHEPTKVVVTSGKVSLSQKSKPDKGILLSKGKIGVMDPITGQLFKAENNDPNCLAWKTGILTFNNNTLSSVINTLSKHYKTNITITNNKLADNPLTASFDNQSLEEVLKVISAVHNLKIERTSNGFLLN